MFLFELNIEKKKKKKKQLTFRLKARDLHHVIFDDCRERSPRQLSRIETESYSL